MEASKFGLGITLWQTQTNESMKPKAFDGRFLNDTGENYSIGDLEQLAVVWSWKNSEFICTDRKYSFTPTTKHSNPWWKEADTCYTSWLDKLAHFDISVQHKAGSNLKFTDYLSSNPVEEAPEDKIYDEQNVVNALTEEAKLNLKHCRLFVGQSGNRKRTEVEQSVNGWIKQKNIREKLRKHEEKSEAQTVELSICNWSQR